MIWRGVEKVIIRQQRRLARSHVGEDRAALFNTRVSSLANRVAMFAAARLARLFQAAPFNIVKPAMIETAEPAVFDTSIAEIGAAVRAMKSQKTDSTLIVAKQHQLLAQNPHPQRRASRRQLFRKRHRLPITPHHLAARRARSGLGEQIILFSRHHCAILPLCIRFPSLLLSHPLPRQNGGELEWGR